MHVLNIHCICALFFNGQPGRVCDSNGARNGDGDDDYTAVVMMVLVTRITVK